MRKRIVIGVVAIIAVGVLVYVVSQPKRGTVEWHKREYQAVMSRLNHQRFVDKVKQFFHRVAGTTPPPRQWSVEDLNRPRTALLKLGYLSQQDFALTNSSFLQVITSPEFTSAHMRGHRGFATITRLNTNMLRVVTVTEDLPLFAEAVRKVETGAK